MADHDLQCSHCSQILAVPQDSHGRLIHCESCLGANRFHFPHTRNQVSGGWGKIIRRPVQTLQLLATKLKEKLTLYDDGSQNYASMNCDNNFFLSPSDGAHHGKRAFLCGVSYKRQKHKLIGAINDVRSMRKLLLETYHFPKEAILVLTEMEPAGYLPTKKNIQRAFEWLVRDMRPGDSLVFYYSGHGLRQLDFNEDELDGFDETLCPMDYKEAGMIIDNEINVAIVRPLIEGVTLHAIVDSCHSGTILDLAYVYDKEKEQWEDNRPPSGADKSTAGGLAVSLGACKDKQLAADTSAFTKKRMTGAMTWSLIHAVRLKSSLTYGELLDSMLQSLKKGDQSSNACSLNKVFQKRIIQDPQLSASEEFDIYSKPFQL
uniref:Peptidase C14 caspase domain-containing protein n=1 Tax=Kalanchoe fedtschenkoi TaxID=63787 RepID=A0A7N0T184_KALFE